MSPFDQRPPQHPPVFEASEVIVSVLLLATGWFGTYLAHERYHLTSLQIEELICYLVLALATPTIAAYLLFTARSRRERRWPPRPLVVSSKKREAATQQAWSQGSVVLGYDVHGEPCLWPDDLRTMHGIVVGNTGSGKTTWLHNIITQDIYRVAGAPDHPSRIPMIICGGKGDKDDFYRLLPHVVRAGRLHQLRLLDASEPNLTVGYNPFVSRDEDYTAVANMVFGSFNLHDEFFSKHQLIYLGDIVRVLAYTGLRFNFYDVLVMGLDEGVLREQIDRVAKRLEVAEGISTQRKLNFEMSVRNLLQSLQDRERVQKIQGLLNECMNFLADELSVVTGSYDGLLSLDQVIEESLILYVNLNVNKNTEPVRALGKMILQNLQLMIGKRYENRDADRRAKQPFFSVVLDEFAPFAYRNFAQILQTARGTNTAFLFSMQSLPQLGMVGRGFKEDVASAPNTVVTLRTRDEETVQYFLRASALHGVTRRNRSLERRRFFGYETYEETGRVTDVETKETRAQDEHIKNMPTGQLKALITNHSLGTIYRHLHVDPPPDVRVPYLTYKLFPQLLSSRANSSGVNLRFKTPDAGRSPVWRRTQGGLR